jgi:hypothetical protein
MKCWNFKDKRSSGLSKYHSFFQYLSFLHCVATTSLWYVTNIKCVIQGNSIVSMNHLLKCYLAQVGPVVRKTEFILVECSNLLL